MGVKVDAATKGATTVTTFCNSEGTLGIPNVVRAFFFLRLGRDEWINGWYLRSHRVWGIILVTQSDGDSVVC